MPKKTYTRRPVPRKRGKLKKTKKARVVRTGGATRRKTKREQGRTKKKMRTRRPTRSY